jgi:plasmid stabilization system protein ParE
VRVVFSDQAKADLTEIGDHIAKDSPLRALDFTGELEAKALQIGDMPRAFPLLPRYEHYGIRRRPYRNYLIFYRVENDRISIIHIVHGARDHEALLFPE